MTHPHLHGNLKSLKIIKVLGLRYSDFLTKKNKLNAFIAPCGARGRGGTGETPKKIKCKGLRTKCK